MPVSIAPRLYNLQRVSKKPRWASFAEPMESYLLTTGDRARGGGTSVLYEVRP